MFGPVVGNFRSSFREFLYEQCSLHITEKTPSSVKLGSRPRIFLMRSNSSGVSPCSATSSGVTVGSTIECGIDSGNVNECRLPLNRTNVDFDRICVTVRRSKYERPPYA